MECGIIRVQSIPKTVDGLISSSHVFDTMGGDTMEHYVTWSELFAFLALLIAFASLLYTIFYDNHKKK